MPRYVLTVVETSKVEYVVEAPDQNKALAAFESWEESHLEQIHHDLQRELEGWNVGSSGLTEETPDIVWTENGYKEEN